MRQGYIILGILLLFLALLAYKGMNTETTTNPPFGEKPRFLGYESNTIRLEAFNLTQLSLKAKAAGFNVTAGHRRGMDEMVDGDGPVPGSTIQLVYSWYSNYTYFSFTYPEKSNATDWVWRVLTDSLSLKEDELAVVKSDAVSNYQVDPLGSHIGAYIEGVKPDWAIVAKYLGSEVKSESEWVGTVRITFDSNVYMILNSDAVMIENRVAGGDVVCFVNVDGDSDVCFYVDSHSKLDEPITLFTSMFEALGIPKSELARLSFEESWQYPI